jgi:hypothetical protein
MGELFGTAVRKGLAWLTGKFVGEVFVSAVATVLLTTVFSGSVFRAEPPAAAPALPALASVPPLLPPERFKLSIDNPAFAMAPASFTFDVPAQPAHRPAAGVKAAARPLPVPKPRPAAVLAETTPPQAATGEPFAQDPDPASVPPAAPVHRSFTLFGVGPSDLVPSPRHIMGGVSSVGHSIASLADWL